MLVQSDFELVAGAVSLLVGLPSLQVRMLFRGLPDSPRDKR